MRSTALFMAANGLVACVVALIATEQLPQFIAAVSAVFSVGVAAWEVRNLNWRETR